MAQLFFGHDNGFIESLFQVRTSTQCRNLILKLAYKIIKKSLLRKELLIPPFYVILTVFEIITIKVMELYMLQDSEVTISDKKTDVSETFWNPTSDIRQRRLPRYTVKFEEQDDFESEK